MSSNIIKVVASGNMATDLYGYDYYYFDCSAGNIEINLPPAVQGKYFYFYRCDNTANTLTFIPNGTDKINGVNANETYADFCFSIIQCYGDDWLLPQLRCINAPPAEILKAEPVNTKSKNFSNSTRIQRKKKNIRRHK